MRVPAWGARPMKVCDDFGKAGIKRLRAPSHLRNHPLMSRPWVSTNLAISADGKISSVQRQPSAWTSQEDHLRLKELRANADALLVGRGTLEKDRMTLTAPRNPLRCIVSQTGGISPDHPILSTPGGPVHLLVTGDGNPPELPGVAVHRGNLTDFLATLATHHAVRNLHCEGGGQLIRALADLDLIDEFHVTIAGHTLFGGTAAPTATGVAGDFLPASRQFRINHFDPRPDLGECFASYLRIRD